MRNLAVSPIAPFLGQRLPIRGPARLLYRSHAKTNLRMGETVRTVTTAFGDHFEVDLSSLLEWQLWVFGSYEAHLAELFGHLVPVGGHCIDVGANVGTHTMRLAKLVGAEGHVIAVEADEELARRAANNARLNRLANIRVLHAAASDVGGDTRLLHRPHLTDPNKARASLLPHRYLTGQALPVSTVALDDLVDKPIHFIKIDVEGGEAAVLYGAKNLIAEHHPSIVFEYAPDLFSISSSHMDWLSGLGYELREIRAVRHRMTGRTRLELTRLTAPPRVCTNVLATTEQEAHRLSSLVAR